jgi:hypothetical protein
MIDRFGGDALGSTRRFDASALFFIRGSVPPSVGPYRHPWVDLDRSARGVGYGASEVPVSHSTFPASGPPPMMAYGWQSRPTRRDNGDTRTTGTDNWDNEGVQRGGVQRGHPALPSIPTTGSPTMWTPSYALSNPTSPDVLVPKRLCQARCWTAAPAGDLVPKNVNSV